MKTVSYTPHKYGLVPDRMVVKDHAHADPELAAALDGCRVGDWKPAMEALVKVGKDWDRRGLYVFELGFAAARGPRWLDFWRQAEPSSADAAVVYAQSMVTRAWDARGGYSASLTSRHQFESFHKILRVCVGFALKATELVPEDPTPWTTLVTAARGLQYSNLDFEPVWQELLIRDALNRRAHVQALQYWQPKWYGSRELADTFVEETAIRAPGSALAFQLRIENQMEIWLDRERRGGREAFFRRGPGRAPLTKALDEYWDGTVPTARGQGAGDGNRLAWALTTVGRWDEACEVWKEIGGCLIDSSPWLYVRDPAAVFVELRREAFVRASVRAGRRPES
ncbi:hypothetical protein GCM10009839_24720 [Catenulispora yoronensis]|uniref:DUF4034 domain-containing protein n=1 Tax=Catenulispora yoronensis TaxID=450799 RepID=A0ABN2U0A7_9ACTN